MGQEHAFELCYSRCDTPLLQVISHDRVIFFYDVFFDGDRYQFVSFLHQRNYDIEGLLCLGGAVVTYTVAETAVRLD